MSKDLFVGDMHIQINNLDESRKLLSYIKDMYIKYECRNLVFLGDIFHTHSVVRQEVAYLLVEFLKDFYYTAASADKSKVIIIAGNHDGISPTDASKNALDLIASEFSTVVSSEDGYASKDGYVYMPFIHDGNVFIKNAINNKITCDTMGISDPVLVCHQTFEGAAYESGMPVPHGVKSDDIPYSVVISGHIHKSQVIKDKIFYVGTPRAVTAGEANDPKFLHVVSRDASGTFNFIQIPTKDIVKNYYTFEIDESDISTHTVNIEGIDLNKDKVTIKVSGTQTFYDSVIKSHSNLLGVIKFIPKIKRDITKKINIESSGDSIEASLEKYIKTVADLDDSTRSDIWTIVNNTLQ